MKTKKNNTNGQGLSIHKLLAAPFIAAASANSAMAQKQTAFLMDSCFDHAIDEDTEEEIYNPKMITLSMTKNVISTSKGKNGKYKTEQLTTNFQLPILTLIPFNSLCVKDVSVKFDMEIISQTDSKSISNTNEKSSESAELKGAVSYDSSTQTENQYQKKNSSKLSVEMNAGTIPLPVGFTTILDLYTKNIHSTALEEKKV